MDLIRDTFSDKKNLEEASTLSRMIQALNPKLLSKKGKEAFYAFKSVFRDIYLSLLSEFLCSFLEVENLNSDSTPESIRDLTNDVEKQEAFSKLFRNFIIKTHSDFATCSLEADDTKQLPLFYPHQDFVRKKKHKDDQLLDDLLEPEDMPRVPPIKKKITSSKKVKDDPKNSYSKSLLSILGTFFFLIDSAKQGNGLLTYLIQKKLHKAIQQSGHKNYAVSLLSYKHNILGHPNAQFAHQFLWNTSAGMKGKGNKFPRDQKVEHLNRFLKDSFRSLGPNLNPVTAKRINNSSEFGIKLEDKLVDFFGLSNPGKSHSQKDHTPQVCKISSILRKESVTVVVPGRKFKGPKLDANFFNNFDEAKFRTWHLMKDKELHRSSKRNR